jgi:hypothetical protein
MNLLLQFVLTLLGFVAGVAILFGIFFWLFRNIPSLNIGVPGDHGEGFDPKRK